MIVCNKFVNDISRSTSIIVFDVAVYFAFIDPGEYSPSILIVILLLVGVGVLVGVFVGVTVGVGVLVGVFVGVKLNFGNGVCVGSGDGNGVVQQL